jgi:N4-gp56 family major capsid protein
MLSQNMFSTLDVVTRDVLDATSSQIDCTNGVNGNAVTELTQTDLDLGIDYLMGNNAKRMAPVIEGTNKFGTAPIDRAYWAMAHTDIRSDIKALATFIATNEYPTQQAVLQSELGSTEEVRWVISTNGAKDSSSPAIYSNFIVGMNAYASINVDEVAAEMILKPLGAGEDALNRRQTMGWKARYAAVILDDGWIINLRSTKS